MSDYYGTLGVARTASQTVGSVVLIDHTLIFDMLWHQDSISLAKNHLKDWIEKVISHIELDSFNSLVIMAWPHEVMEIGALLEVVDVGQKVSEQLNKPTVVVYNDSMLCLPNIYNNISIIGCDYFAMTCYYRFQQEKISWNSASPRAFWLMGKVYKHNRLPLLYNFVKNNTIPEYLDYSFGPLPAVNSEQCGRNRWQDEGLALLRYNIRDFPKNFDYEQWAWQYASTLDRPLGHDPEGCDNNNFTGLNVNLNLYAKHCLEVISETHYDNPYFMTEKVYRSIALGYPFLVLGKGFRDVLQARGYRMYNDLLHHKFEIDTEFEACSQVIEMENMPILVEQFCKLCHLPHIEKEINQIIQFNMYQLEKYAQSVIEDFSKVIKNFSSISYDFFLNPFNYTSQKTEIIDYDIE
jgi:hypothetical protein